MVNECTAYLAARDYDRIFSKHLFLLYPKNEYLSNSIKKAELCEHFKNSVTLYSPRCYIQLDLKK